MIYQYILILLNFYLIREVFSEVSFPLFLGVPNEKKPIDYTKKLPTDGRPLYLDAQATTPMVRLLRQLSNLSIVFSV
jgi:hypothetical protein